MARTVMSWSQAIWQLSRKPGVVRAAGGQHGLLGFGHLLRFAGDELDPAGRAAGVAAAGVQLVDAGLVAQGQTRAACRWGLRKRRHFQRLVGAWGKDREL